MHQQVIKKWFDKHKVRFKFFEIRDLVIKWNKGNKQKGKHIEFQHLCSPY